MPNGSKDFGSDVEELRRFWESNGSIRKVSSLIEEKLRKFRILNEAPKKFRVKWKHREKFDPKYIRF